MPTAVPAAKPVPLSSARKNATGADVRGRPTSHPPTWEPHRRPAMLAARMRIGVINALSTILCNFPHLILRELLDLVNNFGQPAARRPARAIRIVSQPYLIALSGRRTAISGYATMTSSPFPSVLGP